MSNPRQVKSRYIEDETLNQNRKSYFDALAADPKFKPRNLESDRSTISEFSEYYKDHELPFKKKEKKQKVGVLGIDELTNIVLALNQDLRQIREAKSLEGDKNWGAKHGPDMYKVEDVDINGYTTTESTYPYLLAYYTTYPTEDAHKSARTDGMTFRSFVNSMYNPQYDEWGMKIQSYASQDGDNFAARMKQSGYEKL